MLVNSHHPVLQGSFAYSPRIRCSFKEIHGFCSFVFLHKSHQIIRVYIPAKQKAMRKRKKGFYKLEKVEIMENCMQQTTDEGTSNLHPRLATL